MSIVGVEKIQKDERQWQKCHCLKLFTPKFIIEPLFFTKRVYITKILIYNWTINQMQIFINKEELY